MSSVRSATSAAHLASRAMPAKARGHAGATLPCRKCGSPGQSATATAPNDQLAHSPHSSHRAAWSADSPRVYFAVPGAAGPPPLPHDRRVRQRRPGPDPTWPLWPENPSPKLAACAAALIRRLTVLAVITKTYWTPISAEMSEPVQGVHGPAGDEHHLALAGLIGLAPLDEQSTACRRPIVRWRTKREWSFRCNAGPSGRWGGDHREIGLKWADRRKFREIRLSRKRCKSPEIPEPTSGTTPHGKSFATPDRGFRWAENGPPSGVSRGASRVLPGWGRKVSA